MAKNEITKYDNELNAIPLAHLTGAEMNIFFSIITKMRDKGIKKVKFNFSELKELSDYTDHNRVRFVDSIRKLYSKMLTLNFSATSKQGMIEKHFILFSEFEINQYADEPYVEIQIYDKAIPLLNDLDTWVRYSLHEFNSIRSTYAKTLFRLLKQYRVTGKMILTTEKFLELLAVPKSYKQAHISDRILKPSLEELKPYFENLKITKQHAKKRGNPVQSYTFTFTPEPRNKDDFQDKKKVYKTVANKEVATNSSQKQSKVKTDNKFLDNILGQIDETTKD
ncbi:replication initiation protein [Holzapfeliella sp. JNUCC 72]